MATFAIDDMHSNQLTAGLSEHEARKVAQRMADSRGEPVYLYEMNSCKDDDDYAWPAEPTSEEFVPAKKPLSAEETGDYRLAWDAAGHGKRGV